MYNLYSKNISKRVHELQFMGTYPYIIWNFRLKNTIDGMSKAT